MRSPVSLSMVATLLALLSAPGSAVAQAGSPGRGSPPRVPGASDLSDAERDTIAAAVEARLNGYGDALRRRDSAWFSSFWADGPGFAFASDGRLITDYDAAVTRVYPRTFANLREVAEFTFFNGHTYVLGRDAAVHTTEFRWAMVHLKGDTARAHGSWTYVFRNFGGTWRVVQSAGTHVLGRASPTAPTTPSAGAPPGKAESRNAALDQVKLTRQLIGLWRMALPGDTAFFMDLRPFGDTAFVVSTWYLTPSGDTLQPGHRVVGYDRATDRYLSTIIGKGRARATMQAFWFTAGDTFEGFSFRDPLDPAGSASRWVRGIFKGADEFAQTNIYPTNRPSDTETFVRIPSAARLATPAVAKRAATSESAAPLSASPDAEKATLLALDAEWAKAAAENRDVERIVSFWADDAVVIPPGQPAVVGKQALREMVAATTRIPGFSVSWQEDNVNLSPDGRMAYMVGRNHFTVPGPTGQPVTTHGRAMTVWRKGADGTWKCVLDTWNAAPPGNVP